MILGQLSNKHSFGPVPQAHAPTCARQIVATWWQHSGRSWQHAIPGERGCENLKASSCYPPCLSVASYVPCSAGKSSAPDKPLLAASN
mmetsp:Transcript_41526/g.124102  ORF Transcript_41526/g.124102 Transcript_41526/m.124102 type:complete len:88 (+) Transcript_41526:1024-1287(+)